MSPLQKSEIVQMMKYSEQSPVTAAIGDGGNDVAMIQEAHVGLGIMGKEGRAAVRSADFAFSKFRHLQKVVLVHGHWYYYRVALLVQYFFYKNVVCFTCQWLYAFYNNFSTETLFDGVSLTMYNICYTSCPVFVFALLEQNLDKQQLLNDPSYYKRHYRNKMLTWREFSLWFFQAVWHSAIIFFGWLLFWSDISSSLSLNVSSMGVLEKTCFGLSIYSTVVVTVSLRLLFQSRSWNIFLIVSIIASLAFYSGFTILYQSIELPAAFLVKLSSDLVTNTELDKGESVPVFPSVYSVYEQTYRSPTVWLYSVLVVVMALLPDIVIRVCRKHWSAISNGVKNVRVQLDDELNRGVYELKSMK